VTRIHRRTFLKTAAGLSALPLVLREALAIPPRRRTGTVKDVEHVVILMQENRSFDHYFGCLSGVRGFGDPRALRLPSGKSVFHQPVGAGVTETLLPFRLNSRTSSAECMGSLDHSWKGQFNLWKHHDAWVSVKTSLTMGYFQREDIPFYYALADAFTVCDSYHCSIFGPTDPNRLFLFTGTSGLSVGSPGLHVMTNVDDDNYTADPERDDAAFPGHSWTTYAERLQQAGIDWRVYQEYDNFGDNPLAFFRRFRGVDRDSELYRRARAWVTGSTADNAEQSSGEHLIKSFARDVANDTLPQVSWLVAPTAACEHPDASPSLGESFTAGIIAALAANPTVWAKTVLILNYDENDGFFDHVPPALPAIRPELGASTVSTAGEALNNEPVGLGPRVPAIIVSPWTRGGWVNSQVFDHTSVIRFLETRFGVMEPNISAWRRAVTGDLTSAFDFNAQDSQPVRLPGPQKLLDRLQAARQLAQPTPPAVQSLPVQEAGVRPARPLPYRLAVTSVIRDTAVLTFDNRGDAGACFHVVANRPDPPGPWFFTVEAGKTLSGTVPGPGKNDGLYDLTIFGPNGFFRHLRGSGPALVEAETRYENKRERIILTLRNDGPTSIEVEVFANAYGHPELRRYTLPPGGRQEDCRQLTASGHWYDLSVMTSSDARYLRRFAGHVETGAASITDPAIAVTPDT
jgi:phospholipase C